MKLSHRRQVVLAAAVGAVALAAGRASATQLMYEPFDYTAGTALGGTAGNPTGYTNPSNGQVWYSRNTGGAGAYNPTTDVQIASGNLPSYAGLAPASGNSVSFGTSAAGASTRWSDSIALPSAVTTGSLYYSFLVRMDGVVQTNGVGPQSRQVFASFSTDASTAGGSGLTTYTGSTVASPGGAWVKPEVANPSTNILFGAGKSNVDGISRGTSATWQYPAGPDTNQTGAIAEAWSGQTYFMVLKYTFGTTTLSGGGTQKDTVAVYVNPVMSTLGTPTGEADAILPANALFTAVNGYGAATPDAGTIRSFILNQHRANTNDSVPMTLDELRIGTAWADVTQKAPLIFDGNAAAGPNPSDTNGSWETANTWYDGTTNKSWGLNDNAQFGTGIGSGAVAVNLGTPQTAGKIVFAAGSPTYTVSGSGVTLTGSDFAGIVANQTSTLAVPITVASSQTWTVATGATLTTGAVTATGQTLTKGGTGTLAVGNVRGDVLKISAGKLKVTAISNPTSSASVQPGVSKVNSALLAGSTQLNLTNNRLITKDAQGTKTGLTYSGVLGLVQTGRNGGTWNGNGIITDQGDALLNKTSIGVATAAESKGLSGGATIMWSGQTIDATDTLVMYTYAGDANLDGAITADDYASIDLYFLAGGQGTWYRGDFNYDGDITADDYALIDSAFLANSTPFWVKDGPRGAALSAVPEPASLGMLAVAGVAMIGRRRRRN